MRSRARALNPVRRAASAAPPALQRTPEVLPAQRTAAPPAANLLQRARRLGHRPEAIARQIAPSALLSAAPLNALQRVKVNNKKVRISGDPFKLLHKRLSHRMYSRRLSPRGSQAKFKDFLRKDKSFRSEEELLLAFLDKAEKEKLRVIDLRVELKKKRLDYKRRGRKDLIKKLPRASGWTRPLVLGRPGWTKEHKKISKPGQDIRHIVRNATIKNALDREFNFWGNNLEKQTEAFTIICQAIEIPTKDLHPWEMLKAAYNKLYLHKGNLFGGPSGVNRVIGLAADPLINLGEELR